MPANCSRKGAWGCTRARTITVADSMTARRSRCGRSRHRCRAAARPPTGTAWRRYDRDDCCETLQRSGGECRGILFPKTSRQDRPAGIAHRAWDAQGPLPRAGDCHRMPTSVLLPAGSVATFSTREHRDPFHQAWIGLEHQMALPGQDAKCGMPAPGQTLGCGQREDRIKVALIEPDFCPGRQRRVRGEPEQQAASMAMVAPANSR